MKNDIQILFNKYLSDEINDIRFYGSNRLAYLTPFLENIISHDAPDGYAIINNTILLVEHFEFDSSIAKNKKGSQNRMEIARVKRENNSHDKINCNYTTDNYIRNAIKNFENHYNRIEHYIENLKKEKVIKPHMEIKNLFLIEDATILGNIDINTKRSFSILHCDMFLNKLKNANKLDYILAFNSFGQNNFIWYLDKDNLQDYIKNQVKIEDINIANLSPHVANYQMFIPK